MLLQKKCWKLWVQKLSLKINQIVDDFFGLIVLCIFIFCCVICHDAQTLLYLFDVRIV
jgi:hypothetical protein